MTKKSIIAIVAGIVFPLYAIAGQPSAQITHGPYLQNLSEDEVTVVWTTDKPCKSWVEFSKKEAGKSFYSQSPRKAYASQDGLYCVDTLHRVTVKGLEKNTTYFYRVLSQEVKELRAYRPVMGSVVSTDIWKKPLTFTTLDNHRETLSMVMVNDIHGNNELQKKLLGIAPPQDFDMVLFCGDMCSHINRQSDIFTSFLNTSIELFAAQKPFVYARGNHETRGAYARNFSRYLAGPNGKFYYAFTYGPVRFIVLDCGEDKPDTDVEYSGLIDFDRLYARTKGLAVPGDRQPRVQERLLPCGYLTYAFHERRLVRFRTAAGTTTALIGAGTNRFNVERSQALIRILRQRKCGLLPHHRELEQLGIDLVCLKPFIEGSSKTGRRKNPVGKRISKTINNTIV